jgi:hypothetical protein
MVNSGLFSTFSTFSTDFSTDFSYEKDFFRYFITARIYVPENGNNDNRNYNAEKEQKFNMIKGVNKQIVEINNPQNTYFEKAILYIKPSMSEISSKFLAKEAQSYLKSISQSISKNKKSRKNILKYVLFALLTGLSFAGAYFMIITLIQ